VEFLEALRALGFAVEKALAVNGFGAADGYAEAGEGEEVHFQVVSGGVEGRLVVGNWELGWEDIVEVVCTAMLEQGCGCAGMFGLCAGDAVIGRDVGNFANAAGVRGRFKFDRTADSFLSTAASKTTDITKRWKLKIKSWSTFRSDVFLTFFYESTHYQRSNYQFANNHLHTPLSKSIPKSCV
jgi:hypothetical protein